MDVVMGPGWTMSNQGRVFTFEVGGVSLLGEFIISRSLSAEAFKKCRDPQEMVRAFEDLVRIQVGAKLTLDRISGMRR